MSHLAELIEREGFRGLYRKEKGEWFRLDGSRIQGEKERMISQMNLSESTSSFQVVVEVPLNLFPAYLGCNVHINGEEETLHPEYSPHLAIPLGMHKGLPFPKGISLLGRPGKAGATSVVNFAVVSRNAAEMTLCLLRSSGDLVELELIPEHHKTGDIWHVAIETSQDLNSLLYGWKADGSTGWEGGSCFHPETLLMDPYSKLVQPTAFSQGKRSEIFLGSAVELSAQSFIWEGAPRPRYGFEHSVMAELDLTSLPDSKPTLEAAIEVLGSMAEAGINGVILRGATLSVEDSGAETLAPLSFFAPNCRIFTSDPAVQSSHELKTLIKKCHQLSMEVLLEVQFCLTAEDTALMSLKGLDVSLYFRGKGVLNSGHPVVQELVLDSLHHWVEDYKVDGFVFLNAESMAQDRDGVIQDSPALPEAIAADPLLKACKLVAVSGDDQLLPRLGERGFPHWGVWTEYNTRFQYDFWDFMVMTTNAKLSNIATRITGSADLFAACWDGGFPGSLAAGRRPAFGFNSPVGFFKQLKSGVETDVPHVPTLGADPACDGHPSLVCSLLTATFVSQGVPVSPMDCWTDASLVSYLKKILDFRKAYLDLIQPDSFDAIRGIEWHGALAGYQPDWDGGLHSHFLGYSIRDDMNRGFYVGFNAYQTEIEVQAPDTEEGKTWRVVAYTGLPNTEKEILVPPLSIFHMSAKTTVIMEIIPAPPVAEMTPEV